MTLNKYEQFLSAHFQSRDVFLTGTEVVALISENFRVSPDNARKIAERAAGKGVISTSSPLTFGRRQFVYFAPSAKITITVLKKICKKYRPPLYRLIEALSNCKAISVDEAAKFASSLSEKNKTKVASLTELVLILDTLNLVVHYNDANGIQYLAMKDVEYQLDDIILKYTANMSVDATFVPDLINWLQKHNIIDNTTVTYKNKLQPTKCVTLNGIMWDAFAYTTTTGYSSVSPGVKTAIEGKTIVVLDIVIHRDYELYDLHGFYDRIQIIRNSQKTASRKVLPIVFLSNASSEVIKELRDLRILNFNLGTIYGEQIFDLIDSLKSVSNCERGGLVDPDALVSSVESALTSMATSGQAANFENIKGDLFEALMYPVFKDLYPNSDLRQGVVIKSGKGQDPESVSFYA